MQHMHGFRARCFGSFLYSLLCVRHGSSKSFRDSAQTDGVAGASISHSESAFFPSTALQLGEEQARATDEDNEDHTAGGSSTVCPVCLEDFRHSPASSSAGTTGVPAPPDDDPENEADKLYWLPCFHPICRRCRADFVGKNAKNREKIKCPICRVPLQGHYEGQVGTCRPGSSSPTWGSPASPATTATPSTATSSSASTGLFSRQGFFGGSPQPSDGKSPAYLQEQDDEKSFRKATDEFPRANGEGNSVEYRWVLQKPEVVNPRRATHNIFATTAEASPIPASLIPQNILLRMRWSTRVDRSTVGAGLDAAANPAAEPAAGEVAAGATNSTEGVPVLAEPEGEQQNAEERPQAGAVPQRPRRNAVFLAPIPFQRQVVGMNLTDEATAPAIFWSRTADTNATASEEIAAEEQIVDGATNNNPDPVRLQFASDEGSSSDEDDSTIVDDETDAELRGLISGDIVHTVLGNGGVNFIDDLQTIPFIPDTTDGGATNQERGISDGAVPVPPVGGNNSAEPRRDVPAGEQPREQDDAVPAEQEGERMPFFQDLEPQPDPPAVNIGGPAPPRLRPQPSPSGFPRFWMHQGARPWWNEMVFVPLQDRNRRQQLLLQDGGSYQGQWQNGKKHGRGHQKYQGEQGGQTHEIRYEGEYAAGQKHGAGLLSMVKRLTKPRREDNRSASSTSAAASGAGHSSRVTSTTTAHERWGDGFRRQSSHPEVERGASAVEPDDEELLQRELYVGQWERNKLHGHGSYWYCKRPRRDNVLSRSQFSTGSSSSPGEPPRVAPTNADAVLNVARAEAGGIVEQVPAADGETEGDTLVDDGGPGGPPEDRAESGPVPLGPPPGRPPPASRRGIASFRLGLLGNAILQQSNRRSAEEAAERERQAADQAELPSEWVFRSVADDASPVWSRTPSPPDNSMASGGDFGALTLEQEAARDREYAANPGGINPYPNHGEDPRQARDREQAATSTRQTSSSSGHDGGKPNTREFDAGSYTGEFFDGLRHGYGWGTRNGVGYEGYWRDGKKHGFGCMAPTREACIAHNARNGPSSSSSSSSPKNSFAHWFYVGEWCENAPHGDMWEFRNGAEYIGQYVHGKRTGRGVLNDFQNDYCFDGLWFQGKQHGFGRERHRGFVREGFWHSGQPFEDENHPGLVYPCYRGFYAGSWHTPPSGGAVPASTATSGVHQPQRGGNTSSETAEDYRGPRMINRGDRVTQASQRPQLPLTPFHGPPPTWPRDRIIVAHSLSSVTPQGNSLHSYDPPAHRVPQGGRGERISGWGRLQESALASGEGVVHFPPMPATYDRYGSPYPYEPGQLHRDFDETYEHVMNPWEQELAQDGLSHEAAQVDAAIQQHQQQVQQQWRQHLEQSAQQDSQQTRNDYDFGSTSSSGAAQAYNFDEQEQQQQPAEQSAGSSQGGFYASQQATAPPPWRNRNRVSRWHW
ncbi:unnamed protein product [Amoebophrya sp. A120]|nr:unnamed protein product [Amoebophrya sp. A120]|eukprot:GSA120T00020198001.1